MTEQAQLKAQPLKDIEAEIDRMLGDRPAAEEITLRYVEKTAVGVGEKLKGGSPKQCWMNTQLRHRQ